MTSHTVIILGGNSASNKIWVDDMCAHLNPDFNVATHEYLHWKGADHDIDFDIELARLERFIKRNNIKEYSSEISWTATISYRSWKWCIVSRVNCGIWFTSRIC